MNNLRPASPLLINWVEREATDTVFAIKQPDAFLQYGVLSSLIPAVPPGTCPIAFRLGQAFAKELLHRGATFTPNSLQKTT
jgi:hypothetical protein